MRWNVKEVRNKLDTKIAVIAEKLIIVLSKQNRAVLISNTNDGVIQAV